MAFYFLRPQDERLVLIFSPKCACTSLRHWFAAIHGVDDRRQDFPIGDYQLDPRKLSELDDHELIFFVRDPLRRLVSFYALMVVTRPMIRPRAQNSTWAFADDARRFRLHRKTFREFLFVLAHLRRHGLIFQHHLVPQVDRVEDLRFDQVIATEHLAAGLAEINQRYGFEVETPRLNAIPYQTGISEPVMDRTPDWLRRHGIPSAELFYDDETRELAETVYAEDVALHRSLPGVDTL